MKMSVSLVQKVAVITGAGGGIGHAIAEKLAQQGMNIVLLGGNNLEKLEKTRIVVEKYSRCLMLPGNLTELDFIAGSVKKAVGFFGQIDVLINNAGVAQNTPFEEISIEEFDRIITDDLHPCPADVLEVIQRSKTELTVVSCDK